MVVILLERVPISLRGELSRWMLECKTGVFVGKVSARVREKLWVMVCGRLKGGAATLIYSADTEQGFKVEFWGAVDYWPEDFDGLTLVRIPNTP